MGISRVGDRARHLDEGNADAIHAGLRLRYCRVTQVELAEIADQAFDFPHASSISSSVISNGLSRAAIERDQRRVHEFRPQNPFSHPNLLMTLLRVLVHRA